MDKKPNVFPGKVSMTEAMKQANETGTKIAEQANKENEVNPNDLRKSEGELRAEAKMKSDTINKLEEQIKALDDLAKQKRGELIEKTPEEEKALFEDKTPKLDLTNPNDKDDDSKYDYLSKPQDNSPYDVLELPSGGLLYKNQKSTLKVAYLNAMDESIITNPNLLQSGKFLEILINRKMLDTELKYKDLHVGDRNAIMIWLRSTGYGPMYNISLADPDSIEYVEFQTEIDLSQLKVKNLGAKPDENGHFDYVLPVSKTPIKFKLLTVGDIDDIEDYSNKMDESGEFNDVNIYSLTKQIIEIDGEVRKPHIKAFVSTMRIGDSRGLRGYINEIESGMDMNITVRTPGGGSTTTFLPLNYTFFWPEYRI